MKTLAELEEIRKKTLDEISLRTNKEGLRVVVGMATCGIAAGARPVMNSIVEELAKRNVSNIAVSMTGCIGMCRLEPIVEVLNPDGSKVTYVEMTAEKALKVVTDHLINGQVVKEFTVGAVDN